jgi:isocitrate dehydrogenase
MEKRNVMKSGVLWNEVVTATHKALSPTSKLTHMLADAGGMQLVRWPKQFDVIVTDNLFGDMLSDVAAMLTGSLGMLPSASLGAPDAKTGKAQGALRAGAWFGARHRGPGHRQPDRHDRLLCHVPALFLQHGG